MVCWSEKNKWELYSYENTKFISSTDDFWSLEGTAKLAKNGHIISRPEFQGINKMFQEYMTLSSYFGHIWMRAA